MVINWMCIFFSFVKKQTCPPVLCWIDALTLASVSTQRLQSPISLSVHPESKSWTKSWRYVKFLIIRRWADSLVVPDECWCRCTSAGFLNRQRCAQQMSHLNIRRVSLLMSGSSLKSPQRFIIPGSRRKKAAQEHFILSSKALDGGTSKMCQHSAFADQGGVRKAFKSTFGKSTLGNYLICPPLLIFTLLNAALPQFSKSSFRIKA